MNEKDYRARYGKTHDEWRAYNRDQQKKYRDMRRGKPPKEYITKNKAEEILKGEGHCKFCSMLLSSEYHKTHLLVGCIKAANRVE